MRKNWRGGVESLLKNGTINGNAYFTCYSWAGFTLRGARGTWGIFCNIFVPNISKDQKKSYHLSTWPWRCFIWKIWRWLLHYSHKKFRCESELAIFRTKTLDFILVIRLNCLEKIELRGFAGLPDGQYYVFLITVVRVYCCMQRC